MNTKAFFCLWFPLVLLCACIKSQSPLSLSRTPADGTAINILVRLSESTLPDGVWQPTRSSWSGQPDRVESFILMAYRDGKLDGYARSEEGGAASITLFKGQHYQLYALANVPDFVPPPNASEMETLSQPVGDIQQLESLPMACRVDNFLPLASGQTLQLTFERLFARLVLRLDKGAWGMLRVGSVRLRQAAAYVYPFAATDAERVDPPSSVIDGDAATEADLQRLNAGDSLILYVPQNRQGSLLPGNDNPYRRIPDLLGEKANQCTYLEVSASQDGETVLAGDALCRVYLGCNAADNFDVPGNTSLHLTLFLTDRLMEGDWGWRIDSGLSWQPGVVTGWLAEGMHAFNDLYVGEVFRYAVQPSDAFLETLDGDFSRCSLRFCQDAAPQEADTTLLFSPWATSGDGVWYADVHCRKPTDAGRIQLCLDGKERFDLTTRLTVRTPSFFLTSPPDVLINAVTPAFCPLDIRDRQNRSLSAAYGFDTDVFSLEYSLIVNPGVSAPAPSDFSQLSINTPTASAPFGSCSFAISHSGSDQQLARFLTESLQREDVISLHVRDIRYAIEASCPIRTDIQNIQVRLHDRGTPGSGWVFCVDNPSALPLDWGLVVLPSARKEFEATPPSSCRSLPVINGPGTGCIFANRERILSSGVCDSVQMAVSPSVMENRCQSCGCHYYGCDAIGLEPSLTFGFPCDARLDGKIEVDCDLSVGTPVSCLFASASESWSGDAPLDPVWIRYSAYDDIGEVQVSIGFSSTDSLPTVNIHTDLEADDRLFTASFYGYINGTVYGEPANPQMGESIRFYPRLSCIAVPERMFRPDGQTYLCSSGNFASQYQQILQYEQGSGPVYTYYARVSSIEFGLSVNCEPVNRIYSPVVSGTLRHTRYSYKEGISYYVSSKMTGVAQDMLYLF